MTNVSIVLYKTPFGEVEQLVQILRQSSCIRNIYLIDNSPTENPAFKMLAANYIFNNFNAGYGKAHNIALKMSMLQNCDFHLVVNSDIFFDSTIIKSLEDFMYINTDIGQIMPKIFYPDGQIQYLCKLLPTPFDLIFRRFLPSSLTKNQRNKFELRSSNYDKTMEVPYLSGCFMFLRVESLKKVGIFDERFFMYPEDIDLTRRMHKEYKTVFYPEVHVIHNHAQSSYKNARMLWIHITNLIKYFNKWGWVFDKERSKVNKETLSRLNS